MDMDCFSFHPFYFAVIVVVRLMDEINHTFNSRGGLDWSRTGVGKHFFKENHLVNILGFAGHKIYIPIIHNSTNIA